jgi:hypothetical protein
MTQDRVQNSDEDFMQIIGSPSLLVILADRQDRVPSFFRDFRSAHAESKPFFTKSAGEPNYR